MDCRSTIQRFGERHRRRHDLALGVSRRELFEKTDRPALRPLPAQRYEYAEWRCARVGIDYHVEVDARFYSVPYRLLKEVVDVRVTARTIEVFHQHRRVASHARVGAPHAHVTVADHMPSRHRQFHDWTHGRVLKEAAGIGDNARALVEVILRSRRHPEQSFRSCVGILRLAKSFGADRLEAACGRALEIGAQSSMPKRNHVPFCGERGRGLGRRLNLFLKITL